MKPVTRIPLRLAPRLTSASAATRPLHSSVSRAAHVASIVGTGPPPQAPVPDAATATERVERRKRQAELLKNVREVRNVKEGKSSGVGLKKRFWKDVTVQEVNGK